MSKLQLEARQWVVFDPANKNHRRYYWEFITLGTWGKCPVRFIIDDDAGDLVTFIQRKLVDYYVLQEFLPREPKNASKLSTVAKKLQTLKLVDNPEI
jgi:hypothetical protein